MVDDAELLHRYAEHHDEAAFAELVRRHVDFVYGIALRKVGGDAHLAQDVTQKVFTALAAKAADMSRHPMLTGWLFTSTHYAATQMVRAEHRRRAREEKAHTMNESPDDSVTIDWERLRPTLDDLIRELNDRDRAAVLLRFFEERTLAEIGAALRLTEEGARSRVDRALEKLRAALARRGVTSTSAALATALVGQARVSAPAGFAGTVSSLATTAAATGGVSGLASWLSFMSTAKLSGGVLAAALVLGLSVTANVYLLSRPPRMLKATPAATQTAAPRPASASDTVSVTLVATAELAGLRDQMRAAGASDASIRAALEGILRRRYRERLSADRAARMQRGWWRNPRRTWGVAGNPQGLVDDPRLLREMVTMPLEQLLGPDPLEVAEAEARYTFLPADVRQKLAALDRALPTGWSPTGDLETDQKLSASYEAERQRVQGERDALLAALAPEQRAEYEMRFGRLATGLGRQLEAVAPTEQEFRAVYPIAEAYAKALAGVSRQGDRLAAEIELNRQTVQQLVAAVGYDRALDYVWAGAVEYPMVARVAREANLPDGTAGRVLQLAAETGDAASEIHASTALSVEQKRAALTELQIAARAKLDRVLPAPLQQRLAPVALNWLTLLGEGSYKLVPTALPGRIRVVVVSPPMTIDAPWPGRGSWSSRLVPPRPAGI